ATPILNLTPVTTGFTEPIDVENAGAAQLYVAERHGYVYEVAEDGSFNPTPLLDISDQVLADTPQRGLLSIAFHPNYATNGYLYTQYTDLNGDIIISRFTHAGTVAAPQAIDPTTEFLILSVDHPDSTDTNNGGELAFGLDGYLYIGLGDGGTPETSQDLQSLLGKLLRVDVDGGSPYAIPADNPFVGVANAMEEIWALGLRNPWRYSFDSQTGDMYIGDVGASQIEELDLLPASSSGGENFGWSCYEGSLQGPGYDPGTCTATYIPPIHEYAHTTGTVIVGGYTYRGCQYADMEGKYYFADFNTAQIWSLEADGQGGYDVTSLLTVPPNQFSSFGQGTDGELYMVDYNSGTLYHLAGHEMGSCYVFPVNVWLPVIVKP
ncbi:MAG: PQQ-dependent sugar dehydrogenase, partial [Anaerolineales bacterium]|nr:PQQ-dependent sugar dehydrogenase [Anaerolineales bacterium]